MRILIVSIYVNVVFADCLLTKYFYYIMLFDLFVVGLTLFLHLFHQKFVVNTLRSNINYFINNFHIFSNVPIVMKFPKLDLQYFRNTIHFLIGKIGDIGNP